MAEVPDNILAKAEAIRGAMNSRLQAARSDGNISDTARSRALAKAWASAKDEMSKLELDYAGSTDTTRHQLSVDVFGHKNTSGADAISARDAGDRASKLESTEEAVRLLEWAATNGDDALARAIGQEAYRRTESLFAGGDEWFPVLEVFAGTKPDLAAKVSALIEDRRSAKTPRSMWAFAVPIPPEFSRTPEYSIRAMAEA